MMMMNSTNAVYAAGGVCSQQPAVVDYGPTEAQIFYGDVSQQHYGFTEPQTAEPPNSHLPHQIINESNGLSYTNLDAGHPAYTGVQHRQSNHQSAYYTTTQHHHGHFYRTFEYNDSNHTEVPASYHPTYHGLDSGMSRRSNHPYASAYEAYENQPQIAECHTMSAAAYRNQSVPQQQQHPTYKWMQVKRSLPKPGKFSWLMIVFFLFFFLYFFMAVIEGKEKWKKKIYI